MHFWLVNDMGYIARPKNNCISTGQNYSIASEYLLWLSDSQAP